MAIDRLVGHQRLDNGIELGVTAPAAAREVGPHGQQQALRPTVAEASRVGGERRRRALRVQLRSFDQPIGGRIAIELVEPRLADAIRPVGALGEVGCAGGQLLGQVAGGRPRAVNDRVVVGEPNQLAVALAVGSFGSVGEAHERARTSVARRYVEAVEAVEQLPGDLRDELGRSEIERGGAQQGVDEGQTATAPLHGADRLQLLDGGVVAVEQRNTRAANPAARPARRER